MKKKKNSFFETVQTEVVDEVKDFVTHKAKKKLLRLGEISALVLIGLFLVSIGISEAVASFFPILNGGFSYIIFGITLLIIGANLKF